MCKTQWLDINGTLCSKNSRWHPFYTSICSIYQCILKYSSHLRYFCNRNLLYVTLDRIFRPCLNVEQSLDSIPGQTVRVSHQRLKMLESKNPGLYSIVMLGAFMDVGDEMHWNVGDCFRHQLYVANIIIAGKSASHNFVSNFEKRYIFSTIAHRLWAIVYSVYGQCQIHFSP